MVEKEIETRKEEFEEELLEIERKMTAHLNRSHDGPRGDIRDRLDMGKVRRSIFSEMAINDFLLQVINSTLQNYPANYQHILEWQA